MNLDWIAGFFDGEGSVSLQIYRSQHRRCGYGFTPRIIITQADRRILRQIQSRLRCGGLCRRTHGVWQIEIRRSLAVRRFIRLVERRCCLKRHQLRLLADAVKLLEHRENKLLSRKAIMDLLHIAAEIRNLNSDRKRPFTSIADVRRRANLLDRYG